MSDRQNSKESDPPKEESASNNGEEPKGYYYDDSTGYETYDAEADIDEEDTSEGESQGAES